LLSSTIRHFCRFPLRAAAAGAQPRRIPLDVP
jgi:hypothetical protein